MACVYALVDPVEPMHIRYVGMAKNDVRPYSHAKIARRRESKSYLYKWIRKIQLEGRDPIVMILERLSEGVSLQLLGFVERSYIEALREIGHRLTNTAEGGQGGRTVFGEIADRHREACKKSWEDDDRREAVTQRAKRLNAEGKIGFKKGSAGWTGRNHSEEAKVRMSESHVKRWTPELREEARKKILVSDATNPERRRKIKEARAKQVIVHSEETRRKIGMSWTDERRANNPNKGRVRPQEERDRISLSRKGWKPSEETRANMRAAAQRREVTKRQKIQEGEKQ